MVTFGPKTFTGCCNHPAFRKLFFDAAKRHVDAGVDMLHVDDWAMNASWVLNGAALCFCEPCRAGFREWLKKRCTPDELRTLGITDIATFDYREHLKRNGVPDAATYRTEVPGAAPDAPVHRFPGRKHEEVLPRVPPAAGRVVAEEIYPRLRQRPADPPHPNQNLCGVDVVDFFTGESSQNADYQTEAEFVFAAKAAEAFGMTQVVSPIPRSTARTRAAFATTYALGQLHLVPWDLYMGSDATGIQPRYFGTREQYGDLCDFVHAHQALFDDHESAAEIAVLANADAPGTGSLAQFCRQLARQQLPFHLLLGASRYARLPLRAADLRAARVVVEFSPADTFGEEDRRPSGPRGVGSGAVCPADSRPRGVAKLRGMELLRVEAPEGSLRFPAREPLETFSGHPCRQLEPRRQRRTRGAVPECDPDAAATATLGKDRFGGLAPARPEPLTLTPERHDDCVRLTLPQIETWGVVEIQ